MCIKWFVFSNSHNSPWLFTKKTPFRITKPLSASNKQSVTCGFFVVCLLVPTLFMQWGRTIITVGTHVRNSGDGRSQEWGRTFARVGMNVRNNGNLQRMKGSGERRSVNSANGWRFLSFMILQNKSYHYAGISTMIAFACILLFTWKGISLYVKRGFVEWIGVISPCISFRFGYRCLVLLVHRCAGLGGCSYSNWL